MLPVPDCEESLSHYNPSALSVRELPNTTSVKCMKKTILVTLGLIVTAMPLAQAGPGLAASQACTACHGIGNNLVGPAFKDVATRYAGDSSAPAMLAAKIRAGGAGNWGNIPMPPQTRVSDEEIKTLVDWILSLK